METFQMKAYAKLITLAPTRYWVLALLSEIYTRKKIFPQSDPDQNTAVYRRWWEWNFYTSILSKLLYSMRGKFFRLRMCGCLRSRFGPSPNPRYSDSKISLTVEWVKRKAIKITTEHSYNHWSKSQPLIQPQVKPWNKTSPNEREMNRYIMSIIRDAKNIFHSIFLQDDIYRHKR